MKIDSFLARGIVCAALAAASWGAFAQTFSRQQLQETYVNHLAEQGFRPEVTPAGNVKFRREGLTYVIYVNEKDPTFFRLMLSFSSEDKSPEARLKRLESVNKATTETKVVKAFVDAEGDPNFATELFLIAPADFKSVIERSFRAMDLAYSKYRASLN